MLIWENHESRRWIGELWQVALVVVVVVVVAAAGFSHLRMRQPSEAQTASNGTHVSWLARLWQMNL
jgi:hypothetical protein